MRARGRLAPLRALLPNSRRARPALIAIAVMVLATVAAGCGTTKKPKSSTASGCSKGALPLLKKGQLTIGTDNPAFPPWYGGSPAKGSPWKVGDPNSGQGFESAVAYAVGQKLGFTKAEVKWVVVPFDQSFKPGAKSFDFDINQISFTAARARSVDFSQSYYDVNQALVGLKGRPITKVKSTRDLKNFKLGAQLGTTSYDYIVKNIKPSKKPSVYSTSNDVNSGLKARQIDGIVVDLPTAFYITGAQIPTATIVGQFPTVGTPEHFGMVFQKGSALVSCVNKALASLKADGTLTSIQKEWLSTKASAPILK